MPDQPTEYPHFYGFTPKKRHFIWHPPEEVEASAAPEQQNEEITLPEAPDAANEGAATATSAAPAVVEITSPGAESFADSDAERPSTEPSASAEVEAPSDATNIAVLPALSEVRCLESGGLDPSPETGPEGSVPVIVTVEPQPEPDRTPTELQPVIDAIIVSPEVHQTEDALELTEKTKPCTRKRRRRKKASDEPQLSSLAKHESKCIICRSKWREEIDELFVNWHNVSSIGREYHTPRRVIYRHANATGLLPIRDRNVRCALGLIIHRAENAPDVTADSVIRAVRTLAHINDAGEWTNPPTHVIVSSGMALRSNNSVASPPQLIDTPCQSNKALKP